MESRHAKEYVSNRAGGNDVSEAAAGFKDGLRRLLLEVARERNEHASKPGTHLDAASATELPGCT